MSTEAQDPRWAHIPKLNPMGTTKIGDSMLRLRWQMQFEGGARKDTAIGKVLRAQLSKRIKGERAQAATIKDHPGMVGLMAEIKKMRDAGVFGPKR